MGKAGCNIEELRFLIKPGWTEAYVLVSAWGDCPIGVQGWHYKVFSEDIGVAEIVLNHTKDVALWPQKSPDE